MPLLETPPLGLLVSIAMRLDHALFACLPGESQEDFESRIEWRMLDARRAYEEISGQGFWSAERNARYEECYERRSIEPLLKAREGTSNA